MHKFLNNRTLLSVVLITIVVIPSFTIYHIYTLFNNNPHNPISEPNALYKRSRFFEEWVYPNGTVKKTIYMGPRFVKHHSTNEFVDLVLEDHYETDGFYLVQSAHIGLKIYDWHTVLYDPDLQNIAVDDERFIVEVYDAEKAKWREVDLYDPSLKIDVNETTTCIITRTFDCPEGRLDVSYIVKAGEFLKHKVVFESRLGSILGGSAQFRVIQRLTGIRGAKLEYGDLGGLVKEENVTAKKEFVAPYFTVKNETTGEVVLDEDLRGLGRVMLEEGEKYKWVSETLKNIVFDTHEKGTKVDIVIGDFTLNRFLLWNGKLEIDPASSTFQVSNRYDDTVEYYYTGTSPPQDDWPTQAWLEFGHRWAWRSYMRWPIYIPWGSTITSAKVKLCAYNPTGSGYFKAKITFINKADCPNFQSGNPWDLPIYSGRSPNYVEWNINQGWTAGQWYASPDFKDFLQDFIDRKFEGGKEFVPGNHFGLRIGEGDAAGGESRKAYQYDGGASYAPKLEITYTIPPDYPPLTNHSFESTSGGWICNGSYTRTNSKFVQGSYSWKLSGGGQEYTLYQDVSSTILSRIKNRKVRFQVYYWPDGTDGSGEKNKARVEIMVNDVLMDGTWVRPTAEKWYHPSVEVDLPKATTSVRVLFRGKYSGNEFKAWVDLATLAIYANKKSSTNHGDINVAAGLIFTEDISIGGYQKRSYISVALGAKAKKIGNWTGDYYIYETRLKVELLDKGQLVIDAPSCDQGNDKDYELEDYEESPSMANTMVEIAMGVLAETILIVITPAIPYELAIALGYAEAIGVPIFLSMYRTQPDRLSDSGANGYVQETWIYPDHIPSYQLPKDHFVSNSTGEYLLEYCYSTSGDNEPENDIFVLRVTAEVWFAKVELMSGYWILGPLFHYSVTTYISI